MNIKDWATTITAIGAAAALIGTVVYQTGWIIGKSQAEDIAQQKANVVAQQLYEAQQDNERARLEQDINILMMQLNFLLSKPERTEFDEMQLQIWRDSIAMKQKRIAELNEAETPHE